MRLDSIASLVLYVCLSYLVQANAIAQECSQIDKNQPLPITYEHFEDAASSKTGKRNKLVWLRFHNNSSCRILMLTTAPPLTLEARKQPNGGIKLVPLDHLREGANAELVYKVLNQANKMVYKTFDHETYSFSVLPGGTLTFNVPLSRLKRNQIIVPFGYNREDSHSVSFTDITLPDKLTQK